MEQYKVEVYGWKLRGIPKAARKALKVASDVTDGLIPENLIHVGVAVHKFLYDFNINGVKCHTEVPIKGMTVIISNASTSKTFQDVMNFMISQRQKFNIDTYDPFLNNCIDFAEDFCNFLGVKFTGYPVKLNSWLKHNASVLLPVKKKLHRDRILVLFGGLRPKEKEQRTFVDGTNNNRSELERRSHDVEDGFQEDYDSEDSDEDDYDDYEFRNTDFVTINF